MTHACDPEMQRASLERLLGPPDASTPDELRWTNVRLRKAAMTAGGAYDPGCHELVVYHHDTPSGLRAIVAIHSTRLGPALGGTRWYPYGGEAEPLHDVLRLSAAMTAKAAVAGLDCGGGKAAVIGEGSAKTPAQLAAYARLLERLEGRYITTTDVGTTTADLDTLSKRTSYVAGASAARGGSGDTSELTATTVMHGMRAALRVAFGDESLSGRRVVVVGVGKVGSRVARAVAAGGARLAIADLWPEGARALAAELTAELTAELGADLLDVDAAYREPCDVLSPNALGGVLSAASIPELRCRVVCGAANNQLLRDPEDAALLAARGILYAPDYVVNGGGLINIAVEREGYDGARAQTLADHAYATTLELFEAAERLGISTAEAALRRVEARLAAAR